MTFSGDDVVSLHVEIESWLGVIQHFSGDDVDSLCGVRES